MGEIKEKGVEGVGSGWMEEIEKRKIRKLEGGGGEVSNGKVNRN